MDDAFVAARLSIPEYEESCGGIVTLIPRATKDDPKDDPKELSVHQLLILNYIQKDPTITREEMTQKMNVSDATIKRALADLQNRGLIVRVGGRKNGHWEIKNN